MTDCSRMIDEFLNIRVADSLGIDWYLGPSKSSSGGWEFSHIQGDDAVSLPDYCNDWAAIGPIIEDNKISVEYFGTLGQWVAQRADYFDCDGADKNPRRAAAICFLMMKEAKG